MKTKIENEIECLIRIIKKCEDLKSDCEHEKGELYALEWVLSLLEEADINNNKTINEFKKKSDDAQQIMNEFSNRIKITDEMLKINPAFLPEPLITEEFKLWWNKKQNKVFFENNKYTRALIECPFEIRNMIVNGNHLTNFIKLINTSLS